ncbi:MAG TPA: asparagine synthase (glutamine-hydrolyzing), partial [Methylomirabilota bacterium]|nr:asparagine synthase (glutamine-hydrolyzing) [Methylomirabilota bacterium]
MCGIYGVLTLGPGGPPPGDVLARMGRVTVHRGPDDEGRLVDEELLLGMRRLSIIDLAGGHQPISNEDGTLHVVNNGEIYNYRALTARLERAGHTFRTRSDTEVLVHLYEEHGDDLLPHLNGMYAFALWDRRRRRLLIGRDRLGIKPLYYREDGRHLVFASEAKAILAATEGPVELDRIALQEYLALGYAPAPRSMFAGIRKLPPGSVLVAEGRQVRLRRLWQPRSNLDEGLTEQDWVEAWRATMAEAVTGQMVSDVPLGAFLSGGLDSSTVVSLMARQSTAPIKTYSIGFGGGPAGDLYNELPWARRVAERCRTDHHEIVVEPDAARLLPRLLWHLDEPVADSAFITTFLVAEFARQEVTVILSGVGGDELFGGYRRYLGPAYDRYLAGLPAWLRTGLLPAFARRLPSDRHSRLLNLSRQLRAYLLSQGQPFTARYRSYVQVFSRAQAVSLLRDPRPLDLDALEAAFGETAAGDPVTRMAEVDLLTQLPDDLLHLTDRMTMATSLECRVPFLDDAVVDLSLRMPAHFKIRGQQLKYILKRALAPDLPDDLLHRPKRGFGAPLGAWLKGELAPLVRRLLSRRAIDKR